MVTREFHAFTIKANGRLDRLITDIGVSAGFDPADPPNPVPPSKPTKALWDTGASKSVVSTSFVQSLGLAPVGTSQVHHGDGESTRNTYLVNLYLPNKVCIAGVLVTEFPASQKVFDVLVGMDVICHGDLSITNVDGKTTMSFRTPSCESIDYVVTANRMQFAGVGRNDPCPCKSGKKFKKCHGGAI
jgi:hypothetical protein